MADKSRRRAAVGIFFTRQFPPRGNLHSIRKNIELAVAVDIHQPARFHRSRFIDRVRRPRAEAWAGMLEPLEASGAIVDRYDIGPAVAVYIHRQVCIAIEPWWISQCFHVAHKVFFPSWRFIPMAAAHNIELAIVIHIEHTSGAKLRLGVDHMLAKRDIAGQRFFYEPNTQKRGEHSAKLCGHYLSPSSIDLLLRLDRLSRESLKCLPHFGGVQLRKPARWMSRM